MALHLLFEYVNGGSGSYPKYRVYYDDTQTASTPANYYHVEYRNSSGSSWTEITSASEFAIALDYKDVNDPISVNPYYDYLLYDKKFIYSGTQYIDSFTPYTLFPYAQRTRTIVEQTDINDLQAWPFGISDASSRFLSDGSFGVRATGTNTPFKAKLGNGTFQDMSLVDAAVFNWSNYYQKTFSNLAAGTYQWTVRDNKGYERTGSVVIASADFTDPDSYGVKYYFTYYDNTPSSEGTANQYKVEILLREFTDTSTQLTTFGPDPFLLTQTSEGNNIEESNIGYTTATVQLESTTFRQWAEFINADEDDYKVRFSRYEGGSFVKKWEGFLVSEGITEDLYQPPYIINLLFSDRLKDMEVFPFIQYEYQNEGRTLIERIAFCLQNTKLYNGFRISVHLWESNQDDTTDTPLHQTYSTADAYQDKNRLEVLEMILKSFGARIYGWEGYWYIERIREKKETTINYLEYDSDLTYVGTGSYSPRVTFRTATGSGGWRWAGRQSQGYTPVFGDVTLIMELGKKENGLSEAFNENDGWANFNPINEGPIFANLLRGEEAVIRTARETTANADYIERTGNIETGTSDLIKLKMNCVVKIKDDIEDSDAGSRELEFRGGYFTIEWSLKVGDYYLDINSGRWSSGISINQTFGNQTNSSISIDVKHPALDAQNDLAYSLKIYGCNAFGAEISAATGAAALTALREVPTTSLNYGARIRYRRLDTFNINYYELRLDDVDITTDNYKEAKPIDYDSSTNPKKWFLVSNWQYDNTYYDNLGVYGAYTETTITDFDFEVLPNGSEPPEEFTLSEKASENNVRSKDIYIQHYDYPDEINSSQYLYRNGLRLIDGSPTSAWVDANLFNGQTRTIQEHFLRFAREMYVRSRSYLSGTFFADAFITPKNVIYHSGDDGRIFLLTGVTFDFKNRTYNGEVVEIGRDTSQEVGDFDSSDFSNTDFAV